MAVDTRPLRRRPPGDRTLLYLDQHTRSNLASGEAPELLTVLLDGVASRRLICPRSDACDDEAQLAPEKLWSALDALADALSLGVHFIEHRFTEWYEIDAAAAAFLGKAATLDGLWQEAFGADPHAVDPTGLSVKVRFGQHPDLVAAVDYQRTSELAIDSAYNRIRGSGRDAPAQAALEQATIIDFNLMPLFATEHFERSFERMKTAAALEMATVAPEAMLEPGSAYNVYSSVFWLRRANESLLGRHSELRSRAQEFREFLLDGPVPSLRFPPLLRTAMALSATDRRARVGDGYDVLHLTRGLSRCDVVTADSSMLQLCTSARLVPADCLLFGPRQTAELVEHLRGIVG